MSKFIKGKDGKFAGSVGDGKTRVPTVADTLHKADSPSGDGSTSHSTVDAAYAGYLRLVSEDQSNGNGAEVCPACRQFANDTHVCPHEELRAYAIAEDTATAELYNERFLIRSKIESTEEHLRWIAGQERHYGSSARRSGRQWSGTVNDAINDLHSQIEAAEQSGSRYLESPQRTRGITSVADARESLNKYAAQCAEDNRITGLINEANTRYDRFRWNRAFLVITNGTGHVHSSMNCSTCYPTTKFVWLPQYSGSNEDEIVADAGERGCSVCYPSAPAEYRSRPTQIYSDEERAAFAAREERAVARAERETARIAKAATKDGSELVVVTERGIQPAHMRNAGEPYARKERFKTERSAVSWATDKLAGTWREPTETEREAIEAIVVSLADKRDCDPAEVRAELQAKADAKRRRNGG